ncbi:ornithine carbamoyltransferase [Aquabacterium sp. A7-Y]|uniref:ornithine carbamoyltransferase n=1 Tax=Aquabacterium sp. A7-Y TaxID=1349605 RepID=UPI00223DE831|nr:ornithine carbamoyltransferase [Aquabacterium sp. A7-Y]MCW7541190.1 ornithine carbamoyltransferase [Aquabacterium sp. A7-Y]
MAFNLHGRSLLSLLDLSAAEIRELLRLAADLKSAKRSGTEVPRLSGRNIALIFEKTSTRTRSAFEVAAHDQGAHVTYIGPHDSQLGHKESVKDTARVLGRLFDAIEYRGFGQTIVEDLARYAGVPVYNGLTAEFHPTQVLGDFMTMREFTHKHLSDVTLCYLGDAHSNTADSLMVGAAKVGMKLKIGAPHSLWPTQSLVEECGRISADTQAQLMLTENPAEAVAGADFIYTDVWLSMGEDESLWKQRIDLLKPYRVTQSLMDRSGNPHVKFMHCLPAFHNRDTAVGADIAERFDIDCMEVTDAVFESEASIVFDQAENRMHSIKALLVATLG